jgi:pimeloyl-ACP methyl ester carboxylesterase
MDKKLAAIIREDYINTNGIRLHCMRAGQGEPIILLHGFPESWHSWREQIPVLAQYGEVIALDMRGYNLSDRPIGVENYDIDILAADIVGVIRACNAERATIISHDWGGGVAWWLTIHHPELVKKLVVMNAPHPFAFQKIIRSFDQLRRSWYMFFFQLPWLPEFYLSFGGIRRSVTKVFRGSAIQPHRFTEEDLDYLVKAWEQPGALTAMINYYRAAMRKVGREKPAGPITLPTMIVWGEQDRFLLRRNAEPESLSRYVKDLRVEFIPTAGHWVQKEEPEQVNALLEDFLRQS